MTLKARYEAVLTYFEQHVPEAETELMYDNPYQLLVAVILSAQCTDKRVNLTTPALFDAYPDIDTLAVATPEAVFPLIRSISYPNNKAKHLVGMAQRVRDVYG
ncbi:MAG: endonuclease III, partial [Chitinophagaceae bacterium]|nr:endonuclease III [Chitinophagaceae bacterium]